MQAHNNNIEEFLGAPKTVFLVPVYQRNYDWKDENCKQLFQDIVGIAGSDQEHFLGTICFKVDSNRERSIIDGQQRLTSITLMLKAIYDFDQDEDNREEIRDQYLYNKSRANYSDFFKYKLHLNKRDDDVYHVLLNNTKESVEANLDLQQRNSNVYRNYLLFYDLIATYVDNGGSIDNILEAMRRLTIVELEIQKENPQDIFESLNSTGVDLTNVDLLRNYFLMQFAHETQTKLYEEYWSQIECAVGVDRMEQFFVDFLVFKKRSDSITINGRRSHINEKSLYLAFKDYYTSLPFESNYEKTLSCFKDLKACANLYKNFVFLNDLNFDKESPIRKKLYFLLSINDSSKARSLLLYIFDLYNKNLITNEMLNNAIDGIASLTFRARICKAQGINRQFAGNVMLRLDEIKDFSQFIDSFWQAITIGKGSYAFPSDTDFMEALINKDLYQTLRSQGTRYLLYTLEAHSKYSKGLQAFNDESLSIEHIMPRTLTPQWESYLTPDSLKNYNSSLHRLGNLTLTNYNGELSNKDFESKKTIYKDSKLYYTKHIADYDQWQITEIDDRSQMLAKEALKIWQLPAKYQNTRASSKALFTLDEDMHQFAYTKPSLLLIGNNEYSVNFWADILPIVCLHFDQENHDAFIEIAKPERIAGFGLEDDDNSYAENKKFTHITGNVYIRPCMSSANTLETVKKIAEEFDQIAGTEFAESIRFSLK